jgi:hypothetical protein
VLVRLLLAALPALTACASTTAGPPDQAIDEAEALPLQIAFQDLCDARTLAEAGDMWGAANEFQNQAHAYLHEFAGRYSMSERDAVARLLEAKQEVEAQLAAPDSANPRAVAASLASLETALADAAERVGFTRPVCGGSS